MASEYVTEGQIREEIAFRASIDKQFRNALTVDPKDTIEELLGASLPSELEVVVVEDSSLRTHVVIPEFNEKLSDEQLEAIAGGAKVGEIKGA